METTNNGPIKLVVTNGNLTIRDGVDADEIGVSAGGSGDILLAALGNNANIVTIADIVSHSGNIELEATRTIQIGDDLRTGGAGSVYVRSRQDSIRIQDGPDVGSLGITTTNGDILLQAKLDINIDADIRATGTGDIGILAERSIDLASQIGTVGGKALLEATNDITMAVGTSIASSEAILRTDQGKIVLALIEADSIAVHAGTNILDGNLTSTNLRGQAAQLVAGGSIGRSDINGSTNSNREAIDTELQTLAAQSSDGIYIEEVSGGGNLTIANTNAVTIAVDASQVNFNSTTASIQRDRSVNHLSDLTTTNNGPIKVVVQNGDLVIRDGADADQVGVVAVGSGDILLEARGNGSDLDSRVDILAGGGHISLLAENSVTVGRNLSTNQSGTILVQARNGSVAINPTPLTGTSVLEANLGDVVVQAKQNVTVAPQSLIRSRSDVLLQAELGAVSLGRINAERIAVQAGGDILNLNINNTPNIQATELKMIAGRSIGQSDLQALDSENRNAIIVEVERLASQSADGIYLRHTTLASTLTIGNVGDYSVEVERVEFNSTTTNTPTKIGSLDDLTTTANGPIKLVVDGSNLTITDGNDVDGKGISSGGSGDILIKLSALGGTFSTQTAIQSQTGNIQLVAANVDIGDDITTGGSGDIFIQSLQGNLTIRDGVDIDDQGLTTQNGDILLRSSGDLIIQAEVRSLQSGNIGLQSFSAARLESDIITTGGDVFVVANGKLSQQASNTIATGGGNVILQSINDSVELDIADAKIDITAVNAGSGRVSIQAGNGIIDSNGGFTTFVKADSLKLVAGDGIGSSSPNSPADENPNAIDIEVDTVAAQSRTGIYLREASVSGHLFVDNISSLTIDVDVTQVNFNSSSLSVNQSTTQQALDDLTTTAGPIKLVVTNGNLTIRDGADADQIGVLAGGISDVLLEARGRRVL